MLCRYTATFTFLQAQLGESGTERHNDDVMQEEEEERKGIGVCEPKFWKNK